MGVLLHLDSNTYLVEFEVAGLKKPFNIGIHSETGLKNPLCHGHFHSLNNYLVCEQKTLHLVLKTPQYPRPKGTHRFFFTKNAVF